MVPLVAVWLNVGSFLKTLRGALPLKFSVGLSIYTKGRLSTVTSREQIVFYFD